jgi:flavodoxin
MESMKTLICYASVHHGNTKKIAEAMAAAIGADCVPVKDVKPDMIAGADLVGFGSGIYFSMHHRSLLDAVAALPKVNGKRAFIFSTAGFPAGKFVFHHALKKKLADRGFEIVGEFACKGLDTYAIFGKLGGINKGHPDERDIQNARKFAKGLAKM